MDSDINQTGDVYKLSFINMLLVCYKIFKIQICEKPHSWLYSWCIFRNTYNNLFCLVSGMIPWRTVKLVTYKYVIFVFLIKKQAGQIEDLAYSTVHIKGQRKNKIRNREQLSLSRRAMAPFPYKKLKRKLKLDDRRLFLSEYYK